MAVYRNYAASDRQTRTEAQTAAHVDMLEWIRAQRIRPDRINIFVSNRKYNRYICIGLTLGYLPSMLVGKRKIILLLPTDLVGK